MYGITGIYIAHEIVRQIAEWRERRNRAALRSVEITAAPAPSTLRERLGGWLVSTGQRLQTANASLADSAECAPEACG
ncbi:MAG: hypothetical protein L6Q98_24005 [Anaerolineae bacterium]|nr:hypothetical protein [Anaerolineae bacterium]NUQ06532.1 hypothetical protein [Anaerolineae bacterium]